MMMQSYKKPRKTAFFAPQKRKLFVAGHGAMGTSAWSHGCIGARRRGHRRHRWARFLAHVYIYSGAKLYG